MEIRAPRCQQAHSLTSQLSQGLDGPGYRRGTRIHSSDLQPLPQLPHRLLWQAQCDANIKDGYVLRCCESPPQLSELRQHGGDDIYDNPVKINANCKVSLHGSGDGGI
jgi:hypothetical protein